MRKMAFGKSHWIKKTHFVAPLIAPLGVIASEGEHLELARPQRSFRNVMTNHLETLRVYVWFLMILLFVEGA